MIELAGRLALKISFTFAMGASAVQAAPGHGIERGKYRRHDSS
jgi:hypothetical protein